MLKRDVQLERVRKIMGQAEYDITIDLGSDAARTASGPRI